MSQLINRPVFILFGLFSILSTLYSQTDNNGAIALSNDSLSSSLTDTTFITQPDTITAQKEDPKPFITSEVKYNAVDSIVTLLDGKKVYLFKDAVVTYQDVELKAYFIELDLGKSEAFACGTKDSANAEIGLPVFKDSGGEYTMRTMRYNFKTKKAIIEHVVTEQGEGFVVSNLAKKMANNDIYMKNGMYTTCSNHDHPHFGLVMTKAKVIPGKKIVTGPAYLEMEDVPFPIGIPFGFVPSTHSYSSGFIFPSYGEESNRGFFLRDGGYYWAVNDYFDFQVTGDIFTNLSWAVRSASTYRVRYKFSGNFNVQFITNIYSEKDLPDYSKSKDFSVMWSHRQDSKANPYQTFSASVNFSSSSFDKNNVNSIVDPNTLATNTKRSSISYSKRWPTGPFNLSLNFLHSQNSRDSTIDLTIPDLTLTMNRIYPFKSKNKIGSDEKWFEKISLSYTASAKNSIHTKESELFEPNGAWKNGVMHSVPLSMSLKFLKYFTASPSFNYKERWYFNSIRKAYDEEANRMVVTDTVQGFNRVYDYSYSVGTSTKLYTYFTPWRKLFGDKVSAIRHVMTPSVSMSYKPDFSDPRYGFYESYEYYDNVNDKIVKGQYSYYENSLYGTASAGESGSLGLGLGNTLEMKVKSQKDSTGYKKINILESLNLSSGCNFLADEFKWSTISTSARTKIFKTDLNVNATFDPYALDTAGNRIDVSSFRQTGKLARLTQASTGFGLNLKNDTFKKKKTNEGSSTQTDNGMDDDTLPTDEMDNGEMQNRPMNQKDKGLEMGENGYAKFALPWSLSFNYNMRLVEDLDNFNQQSRSYEKKIISDLTFNGSISPTPKWSVSFNSGFNFDTKQLAYTSFNVRRDLHCWSMSLNLVPFGKYKSYFFTISASSSMLKDLKYEKRSSPRDNPGFY